MEPVRPGSDRHGSWWGSCPWGWVWGTGDSYSRPQSPWQGLGRRHLASLRLGGSGGGLIVTQWVLATAEGGEHAVPELEEKGHKSGSGSIQSVDSKLAQLARFASFQPPSTLARSLYSRLKSGSLEGSC